MKKNYVKHFQLLRYKRRFQVVLNSKKHIVIDDYAHHPNEIIAVWNALKDLFPYEKNV